MIEVKYKYVTTPYAISKLFKQLESYPILSFDVETQSVYSVKERKEAKKIVEKWKKDKNYEAEFTREEQRTIRQIAKASGLSAPELVKVTHFIFGLSKEFSYIIICYNPQTELQVWKRLTKFKGKLLIHNALYDLKIMYNRVQTLPVNYEDTQLMAKTLINDADDFESQTGLKKLMGSYYSPKWTMIGEDGYDNPNYKDKAFLNYSAIDGCATYLLYTLLTEEFERTLNDE